MHQLFRNYWKDIQVGIDVTLSVLGKNESGICMEEYLWISFSLSLKPNRCVSFHPDLENTEHPVHSTSDNATETWQG